VKEYEEEGFAWNSGCRRDVTYLDERVLGRWREWNE
jgi:hypothetical protein